MVRGKKFSGVPEKPRMILEYKEAIFFLIKYVGIYLVLNTVYAFYVQHHSPDADPVTIVVTQHTAGLLSFFDPTISYFVESGNLNVPITKKESTVMMVYEGCNSVNVMIVFVAFIISFSGPLKLLIKYSVGGLGVIYLANLLRLMGLYAVALQFPGSFYFFHKFFFTGVIYLVVFAIWYFWVADIKRWRLRMSVSNE